MLLEPQSFEWFANYLVVKRVATQANYHPVYYNFLAKLDDKELLKQVLSARASM